jgi:MoaA/NifB/PqqE/SkfB family radical SAM enzyme
MSTSRQFLERLTPAIAGEVLNAVRRERAYSRGEPFVALPFLTYRCTSRCRTCKMWSMQWDIERELTCEEWLRVADILLDAGVRVFEMFGGDALLRKDALFPLIRRLKQRNAAVHIPTNSRLLDEETARIFVDAKVDFMYLSTDGVEGVHDKVRGIQDSFSLVKNAVAALLKYRGNRSAPRIICNTTVSKFNADSLEAVADFASRTGFDEIDFEYVGEMTKEDLIASTIDGIRPTPYYLRDGESVLVSPAQAVTVKRKLQEIISKYFGSAFRIGTMNIDFLSEEDMITGSVPKRKCYMERCQVTVDPAGNVVACPFFHSIKFGNLLKQDFQKLWRSDRHTYFHRYLKEKGLPMCHHCIPSIQRNHPFSERLERIYMVRVRAAQRRFATRTHA